MKGLLATIAVLAGLCTVAQPCAAQNGFDSYGYNYRARIFVGKLDGADRVLDGAYWGDPTFANDMLVMKWSKAWDMARFEGAPWTPDAWVSNEFNGQKTDGSGWSEHVKIIWVGADLENSPYWRAGGIPIWGQFEVIMDQGIDGESGEHQWWVGPVEPAGYGASN